MKVLLMTTTPSPQSICFGSISLIEPLALEYIGAGVRDHHDVKLVDFRLIPGTKFKDILESFKPDIIGSTAYTTDVLTAKKMLSQAKKLLPGTLTVIGGHHATMVPADFMDSDIDVIVTGAGVEEFKKICEHHEKAKSFEEIKNIYCRSGKNREMVFTGKAPFPELDTLPLPDRTLISAHSHEYMAPPLAGALPVSGIRGSCGCVYQCKFCAVSTITNRKIYKRSIDNIIQELESLENQMIIWVDDEFLIDPSRAILLAKEIEKAGIKKNHYFYARADHVVKRPDCVEAWAKIGLSCIMVGLESHREKDLKEINKGCSLVANEEAIRIMHANNVKVRGGFIVQCNFEKDDFRSFTQYVRGLNIDFPNFSVLTPLPGTKFYEEVKPQLITNNYDLFDGLHPLLPTKLPLKEFFNQYIRLFTQTTTLKKKIGQLRQLDKKIRWKTLRNSIKLLKRVKTAYRDYHTSQQF